MSASRVRAVIVGAPKVGKTGSLAVLANAGYRVIVAALDPGADILFNAVLPEHQGNLLVLPFEDRMGFAGKDSKITVGPLGDPVAFAKFVAFLNDGKARLCEAQGGEIVDLGAADTWDARTVLVIDNLSSLSGAAFARLLKMQGLTRQTKRRKDWGLAADEVDSVLIQLTSSFFHFNLVVLAHWKVQGPREFEDEGKDASRTDYTNELREREKDLIPTKQVPISIGRQLSGNLLRHFPAVIWAEVDDQGRRIFNLAPSAVRDSGVPVAAGALPKFLPIEVGLLDIFRAITGRGPEETAV